MYRNMKLLLLVTLLLNIKEVTVKIALILDKSQAYIDFQRERIREDWRIEKSNTRHIERLSDLGGATLFGDLPAGIIHLSSPEEIKLFITDLTSKQETSSIENFIGSGLIISTDANRNSTKKLEALITQLNGTVYGAKSGKGAPTLTAQIMNELHIPRQVKDFVIEYLGDDYEGAIALVRTLTTLTPEQQKRITIDDMAIRLPQPPGSVPPWEIEKHLNNGNMTGVIDTFRRVSMHSSPLVVLAILNNKLRLAYKASGFIENDPYVSSSTIAQNLKIADNYPLKLSMGTAKKLGKDRLLKIVELLSETERKIKGGSTAPALPTMEIMLVQLGRLLQK